MSATKTPSKARNKSRPNPIPTDTEIIDLTRLPLSESENLQKWRPSPLAVDEQHSRNGTRNDINAKQGYSCLFGEPSFNVVVKCKPTRRSVAPSFTQFVFFPWDQDTLLWNGDVYAEEEENPGEKWKKQTRKWRYCAAVAGGKIARIIHAPSGKPVFQVSLPDNCEQEITHVTWAVDPWTLHPLLIYVHTSVLHVVDVEDRKFLGCLCGHGADITALGVHHLQPHLVFSTSRDCTTRVYDFRIKAGSAQDPFTKVVRDPFGRRIDNLEGDCVLGRCVVVLTGGRSGGHEASVLGADFHLRRPLIVTCGMDHALRIWYLSPSLYSQKQFGFRNIHREDKPLFSCTTIHDGRVLGTYWLSDDTILSHSTGRLKYIGGKNVAEERSGTVVVWQWLSIERFFPKGETVPGREPPLRGCISDYRESSSFKVIAKGRVPPEARRLVVYRNAGYAPLLVMCVGNGIMVVDVRDMPMGVATETARRAGDVAGAEEIRGWRLRSRLEVTGGYGMSLDGRYVGALVGASGELWVWYRGIGSLPIK